MIHQWAEGSVSNSEMSIFCSEQGRTRVDAEAYFSHVAGEKPRRTPLRVKRAIYVVEDRIPRVYPWMNEPFLVSVLAEVRSAHVEPWQ